MHATAMMEATMRDTTPDTSRCGASDEPSKYRGAFCDLSDDWRYGGKLLKFKGRSLLPPSHPPRLSCLPLETFLVCPYDNGRRTILDDFSSVKLHEGPL